MGENSEKNFVDSKKFFKQVDWILYVYIFHVTSLNSYLYFFNFTVDKLFIHFVEFVLGE